MGTTSRSLIDLIEAAVQRHDGASGRRLAEIAQRGGHEVSHATLNRLRQGTYASRPSDASIRAIAYLAEVPETMAFAAAGARAPMADRYEPPAEAQRMSTPQRKAIDQLLRAFLGDQVAVPPPLTDAGFADLLATRDRLAAAISGEDGPVVDAAREVIAAIDDVMAALFTRADNDDDDGPWPPADGAAPVMCLTR